MIQITRTPKITQAILILLVTVSTILGCASIRLISNYDEQIDSAVTNLQKNLDTFLVKLERNFGQDPAKYVNNKKFYDVAKVDLRAMQVRAAAQEKNQKTIDQLRVLQESLNNLEQLHELGFQRAEEIPLLRRGFEKSFTAILKLELAKKRGENKNSNSE